MTTPIPPGYLEAEYDRLENARREREAMINQTEATRFASPKAAETAADDLALQTDRECFVYRRDTGGYKVTVTKCGDPLYTAYPLPF